MKTMIIMKATLMNRKLFKKSIYYRVSRSLCRVVPCFWHCCYYLQILKGSMIFRMRDFSKQIQHSIFEKQNTRTDKLHSWKAVSIATFEHKVDGLATKKRKTILNMVAVQMYSVFCKASQIILNTFTVLVLFSSRAPGVTRLFRQAHPLLPPQRCPLPSQPTTVATSQTSTQTSCLPPSQDKAPSFISSLRKSQPQEAEENLHLYMVQP